MELWMVIAVVGSVALAIWLRRPRHDQDKQNGWLGLADAGPGADDHGGHHGDHGSDSGGHDFGGHGDSGADSGGHGDSGGSSDGGSDGGH
jgi:hypothetical protein